MKQNPSQNLVRRIYNNHKKVFISDIDLKTAGLQAGLFAKRPIIKGEIIFIAKGKIIKMKIQKESDSKTYPNAIGIDNQVWLDPFQYNPLRYLNHSCEPNVGIKGKVTFVALRNIKKGEHITLDYSITESDSYWELDGICACGAKTCRGKIKSIQYLPQNTYKKYLPYIPKPFQIVYKTKTV